MPHRKNHSKRNTIDRIHRACKKKSRHYASWDNHPYSHHIHWFALSVFFLGALHIANQPWFHSPQSSYFANNVSTRPQSLFAANNTWTQTDWSGGNDEGIDLNIENQTQWNMYRAIDSEMTPGIALTLAPIKNVVTHDSNLSSGTKKDVTETSGSITLDIDKTKKETEQNNNEDKDDDNQDKKKKDKRNENKDNNEDKQDKKKKDNQNDDKKKDEDNRDKKGNDKTPDVYVQIGELTSEIIALEQRSDFTAISWKETLPQDTNIRFQLASNNDQITWDFIGPDGTNATYYTTAEGESISARHDGDQYLTYKAFLTTTNTSVTPALSSVTVEFQSYPNTATLTSSAFNTTDPTNKISKLSWTEDLPNETDINVRVRTAPDQNGVPGTFTPLHSYSDPTGEEPLDALFADGTDDQWIQYLVTLSTTDSSKTPSLTDLSIQYEPTSSPIIVDANPPVMVEDQDVPPPSQPVEPIEPVQNVQPIIPIEEEVSTSPENDAPPSDDTTQPNTEQITPEDPSPPIPEQIIQEESSSLTTEQSVETITSDQEEPLSSTPAEPNPTPPTLPTETLSVVIADDEIDQAPTQMEENIPQESIPPSRPAVSTPEGGSRRIEQPTAETTPVTETALTAPAAISVIKNNVQTIESDLTQTIPTDIQLLNNASAPLTDALQSFLVTIRKREMLPLEETKITLSRDKALLTISPATTTPNDGSEPTLEASSSLDRLLIDRLWERFVPALTSPFVKFLGNAQVIIFAGDQNERSKEEGANDTGDISSDITLYFEIPNTADPTHAAVGFYNKETQMWERMEQEITISGNILSVTIHKLGVYSLLTTE